MEIGKEGEFCFLRGSPRKLGISVNFLFIPPRESLIRLSTHSPGGIRRRAPDSSPGDAAQRVVAAPIGHVPRANDHDADVQDAGLVAAQEPVDPFADAHADAAELVSGPFHDQ